MQGNPLAQIAETITADPKCRDFAVHREVKRLYRAIADEGPLEVLAVTHPTTSTEFFVGWTAEGKHRLAMLQPGPFRDRQIEEIRQQSGSWTDAYRKYRDDHLNRRAYLFQRHGTLYPDLEASFVGIWVAEIASLHAPGHDDHGEIRSDGQVGLCRALYATAVVGEVIAWLIDAIASINRRDNSPPPSLRDEQLELDRWAARRRVMDSNRILIKAEADRARDALDAARLYAMFPRDNRGRLRPRLRVLLEPMAKGSDRERRSWVVAIGPQRAGGDEISIDVENLIAANQSERFDLAPWCWRRGAASVEDARTWSYRPEFNGPVTLLRQGRIKEGLEASGLTLDEAVSNLTRGSDIGLLHPDPDWPTVTRDRLCRCAPWLLLGPGADYARALLSRKADGLRLFTLPNQRAIRKASIVLVPGSKPSLEIRWTGTNARLPNVLWQRPPIPGIWRPIEAT